MHVNSTVNKNLNQVSVKILLYNIIAMTNLLTKNLNSVTTDKTSLTCAHALVDALVESGVDSIFGYPGAAVLSIYNELSKSEKIRHILVRHEQAAVHAAEGYARVSGKVGVVLVTSGPGFTNTITGIANAYADSTPLVVLAGDVPAGMADSKVFQKVDIISMTKTCSKKNYMLSEKDDIKQVIKEAIEVASSGQKGPVVIALPRNILESKYIQKPQKELHNKKLPIIPESDYEKVCKLIQNAKSPLLLLGAGASDAVDYVKEFVSKTHIPVISTLMGIGVYPSKDEMYLGMIGINGTYSANAALSSSDLIIALGASFSDRSTCKSIDFAPNAKIINVNIKKIQGNFELEVNSNVNTFLSGLLLRMNITTIYSDWNDKVKLLKEENVSRETNSTCLRSSNVLETIYEYTKHYEPLVVTDVGQHQMLTAQFFNFAKPKKFITSGGLGTMGFGLPASIGAYIANPSNLVLNITGDGSFQMNLQELATCREHKIPVKIVIMNNGYLGMVRQMQEKIYDRRYQVEMINPDFTKIAEAYDLFAVRVKTHEELIPALQKAMAHDGTAIIDIDIDSFEEI